jgi:hypothetical protein
MMSILSKSASGRLSTDFRNETRNSMLRSSAKNTRNITSLFTGRIFRFNDNASFTSQVYHAAPLIATLFLK